MDLYSGEILTFNISIHPTVEFALKPLHEALEALPKLPYRQLFIQIRDFSIKISAGKKS
jgi:transposase InsO family protein